MRIIKELEMKELSLRLWDDGFLTLITKKRSDAILDEKEIKELRDWLK